MNKTHWNTLEFDGSFDDEMAKEWILGSYNLVASGLTQKLKHELEELS
jgi:predicted DNA-binding protein (MmcQ/YjbR family)